MSKFLGKEYFEGYFILNYIQNFNINLIKNNLLEKYLSYYLFNSSSNALFYYEGVDKFLLTNKFKHSLALEYLYGLFPTVIIGIIILPSMYLLYSNETDINPAITIKVLGRQ